MLFEPMKINSGKCQTILLALPTGSAFVDWFGGYKIVSKTVFFIQQLSNCTQINLTTLILDWQQKYV